MPGRDVIKISICFDLKIRSRASSNLAAVDYSVRNMCLPRPFVLEGVPSKVALSSTTAAEHVLVYCFVV